MLGHYSIISIFLHYNMGFANMENVIGMNHFMALQAKANLAVYETVNYSKTGHMKIWGFN